MILLASLDAYVFELAGQGGLANRKYRRVFPVVLDRMRIVEGPVRQLQPLGLDRVEQPPSEVRPHSVPRPASSLEGPPPASTPAMCPTPNGDHGGSGS
jgi:hypothetical protein